MKLIIIYNFDKKNLSKISLENFEKEYEEIYGQFELKIFNNSFRTINFDCEKNNHFSSKVEEKKFYETLPTEIINAWFYNLLLVAIHLNFNNYIAIQDIESSLWLEFYKENNKLKIGLLIGDHSNIEKTILYSPKEFKYIWQAKEIEYNTFLVELYLKTKKFILEIQTINPLLLKSKAINQLLEKYNIFLNSYHQQ